MKKTLFYLASFCISMLALSSCGNDDDAVTTPTNPTYQGTGLVELTGNLPTQTLTKNRRYLIKGQVFVQNSQTLTIEPGTVIYGDKVSKGTLIIAPGGRIIANGTVAEPIVFTSALPAGARD